MSRYSIGSLVKFRGREWIVMAASERDVLQLRPLTGAGHESCGVYLPLEEAHLESTTFPLPTVEDIGDFESARLLRDAARLLLRQGAAPLRSAGHLNFRPRPYQFVPLLMALRLQPVRMLIADDVGVGKTIEAGLIARELLDRGEVQRIAVICPSYLCDQWRMELHQKFNVNAKIIRTSTLARLERDLPRPSMSVFEYYPHIVVSIDYVKSERRRDNFLQHLPDLVIVDEAHGCTRPSGQSIVQQQRHQLIADIAKKREKNLILVTATPHSGIESSFLSLLGLIDPDFEKYELDRISQDERAVLAKYFIQRTRKDVEQWMDTETSFPDRIPYEIPYKLSREYKEFFRDIYRFTREVVITDESQQTSRRRVRYWAALALLRCVMSSPAAAKAALMARLKKVGQDETSNELDYSANIYDPTEIETIVDVVPTHVIEEGEAEFSDSERRKLKEFANRADKLKGESDAKIEAAEQEIRNLLKDDFKPIIFCRFIATANYVAEELKRRLKSEFRDLHVLSVTGLLTEEERELRVAELANSRQRLLVATDCLSEGINLQDQFNAVLHYDLPWNPNRLEQREGRVDRFGQTSKIVRTIVLYGADNPVDGAVLNVLLRKAKKIHRTLGIIVPLPVDSDTVIETVLKALFLRGADSPQMNLFEDEAPVMEVHRNWDRAAEREKRSRSLFAQHAIKPAEVAKELDEVDSVLGSPEVVKNFVVSTCQRLGSPLKSVNDYWRIDIAQFPNALRARVSGEKLEKISFERPHDENVVLLSRNHPFISALSEYLFDNALNQTGNRKLTARCGVFRSNQVKTLTTLLLMRLRFIVKSEGSTAPTIAEECVIAGFEGLIGEEKWLEEDAAELLFETVQPSVNLSESEKKHWANSLLRYLYTIEGKLNEIADDRVEDLTESYERVRKANKSRKIYVKSSASVDILAISIILPQPKI